MPRASLLLALGVTALLSLPPAPAAAYGDDAILRDRLHGITLHAPYGWHLHRQNGYPNLRALLVSRDGVSTISLTVGHLRPGQTLAKYVKENCIALGQVGLQAVRCGVPAKAHPGWLVLEARALSPARRVEQLYRAVSGKTVILTLSAPSRGKWGPRSSALWRVLDSLVIAPRDIDKAQPDVIRATSSKARAGEKPEEKPGKPGDDSQDGAGPPLPELETAPLKEQDAPPPEDLPEL